MCSEFSFFRYKFISFDVLKVFQRALHQCLPIFLVGSLGLLGAIRLVDEPTS